MIQLIDQSEAMLLLGLSSGATDEQKALALLCMTHATGAIKRHLRYDPVYASRTEYYPLQDNVANAGAAVWDVTDTIAYEQRANSLSSELLQLKNLPLRSIVSLKIDYDGRAGTRSGSFAAATAKTEGVDFWPNYDSLDSLDNRVCMDGMLRSQGLWPRNPGSVRVEYYSGYKSVELRGQDDTINASPIWEACCDEMTRRFLKVMSRKKNPAAGFVGPLSSESLGDYSYTVNAPILQTLIGGGDILPETADRLSDYTNYGLFM